MASPCSLLPRTVESPPDARGRIFQGTTDANDLEDAVFRKGLEAIFSRAARPVYREGRRALTYVLFERRTGIRTSEVVRLEDVGLAAENRWHYAPSGWLALRRILPTREVSPNDVFIDFGSGMGRVVYQAARAYPFKRVVGVELSKDLHEIARDNLDRTRDRLLCKDVTLVNSDVLDYEIPDDVSVAYFNNPFTGQIFTDVIRKLKASLTQNPRPLRIIYANPLEEGILLEEGATVLKKVRGLRPSQEWSRSNAIRMYALSPGAPATADRT